MPSRGAMPACARLIEPPVEAYSVGPLAWLSAMASAYKVRSACGCQPALSRSGDARRPILV
jgi:hypothetical protein